jgi:hypothetical protein
MKIVKRGEKKALNIFLLIEISPQAKTAID